MYIYIYICIHNIYSRTSCLNSETATLRTYAVQQEKTPSALKILCHNMLYSSPLLIIVITVIVTVIVVVIVIVIVIVVVIVIVIVRTLTRI